MPEKTFSQKAVESVALRFILFVATSAGYAVLAWYAAHSAYLYAIPFYKIGPVIAVMALLGAATIYVLIVRRDQFMLRQSLSKEDAEYIKNNQDQKLTFDNLVVWIVGGDDFQDLPRTPLNFRDL